MLNVPFDVLFLRAKRARKLFEYNTLGLVSALLIMTFGSIYWQRTEMAVGAVVATEMFLGMATTWEDNTTALTCSTVHSLKARINEFENVDHASVNNLSHLCDMGVTDYVCLEFYRIARPEIQASGIDALSVLHRCKDHGPLALHTYEELNNAVNP